MGDLIQIHKYCGGEVQSREESEALYNYQIKSIFQFCDWCSRKVLKENIEEITQKEWDKKYAKQQ